LEIPTPVTHLQLRKSDNKYKHLSLFEAHYF
jgi:hypothetical protein